MGINNKPQNILYKDLLVKMKSENEPLFFKLFCEYYIDLFGKVGVRDIITKSEIELEITFEGDDRKKFARKIYNFLFLKKHKKLPKWFLLNNLKVVEDSNVERSLDKGKENIISQADEYEIKKMVADHIAQSELPKPKIKIIV